MVRVAMAVTIVGRTPQDKPSNKTINMTEKNIFDIFQ